MLSFMRSAPPQPLIRDQAEIDATYRHWRLHLLLTMYLGYAVFYFTRKSFNFAMPDMLASGMLDKSDIGMLWTLFYITYGCSKFFSGIISDRANPRYFMGIGLMATGVINILFGLSSALWMFAALWVANAFFQGWGWPPCSKLLTSWYSRTERGFWWSAWNTAHNVGGALIPLIVSTIALQHGWRYGMIVPGLIAILAGLLLCWRLRDTPSTLGLPTVGQWRQDALEMAQHCIKRIQDELAVTEYQGLPAGMRVTASIGIMEHYAAASGETCPIERPDVPPENRPSVIKDRKSVV